MMATAALVAASAQQLTVTLTGSMHNGSSIPCFGKKVGTITSTVTGGTAPYTYDWSNGETTPSITDVSAGFYSVDVKDADGTVEKALITLTEPEELKVTATVSSFQNGHNISCFECNNGYIQVLTTQGTPPYSYAWSDGPSTAQNRYALGPKAYKVTVTDANGCESSTSVNITQPERSDWTMTGNAGTNPATQYIGTSDNKDVVFKANGQESLRLKANGGISLLGDLVGTGPVIRDSDGSLRLGGDENLPVIGTNDCYTRNQMPFWNSTGNAFGQVCPDFIPRLGTLTAVALDIVTNATSRMVITPEGKVGIGTGVPEHALTVASNGSRTVLEIDNRTSGSSASGELRFSKEGEQRWGLGTDFGQGGSQDFYIWDHLSPTGGTGSIRLKINEEGRVAIGDVSTPAGYRLCVQEGIITEKVRVSIRNTSDWNDHVFNENYALPTLKEVAQFIKMNAHLPGIPSAACMVEEGLDVAQMDALLLGKIEEITLHLIRMADRVDELERQNKELQDLLDKK